jgi:hypothetical protein
LITPLTKTTPEIPEIGEVTSEIPNNMWIISPGGKLGITVVMPKRTRKDARKSTTTIIFYNLWKTNLFFMKTKSILIIL